jgi:superfamily II DNA/RNA helicase
LHHPCIALVSTLYVAVLSCLQVLLFSATLHSPEVRALAAKICQNPIIIDLKGKDAVPETGALGAAGVGQEGGES